MKYLLLRCLCMSTCMWLPTLNATSFLTYLVINLTNMRISIPSHHVTLEKESSSQHGENICEIENNGCLSELDLGIEDEDDDPIITFRFKEPAPKGYCIQVYQDDWGALQADPYPLDDPFRD